MDLKKLNDKQKKALTIGGVVAAAAVFLGFRAMNQGTPADPKLKILGIDNAGSVHFTINGTKHVANPTGAYGRLLSDKYGFFLHSEKQPDGSLLVRFFHTGLKRSQIISELGRIFL